MMAFLKMFSNCIPVKGATQSLICDLQRNASYMIPNSLYEFIQLTKLNSIPDIHENHSIEEQAVIQQYIDFLVNNELAFRVSSIEEKDLFPELSMEWDHPSIISNAIIDVDRGSQFNFADLFTQFEDLGCRSIQIRIYDELDLHSVRSMLSCAEGLTIRSIQLYIKYISGTTDDEYLDIVNDQKRITGLFIHSADEDRILKPEWSPVLTVAKTKHVINSASHCGVVDKLYFNTTTELFTESQSYNNCLNRKIGITAGGEIKNCPSLERSFGNIKNVKLAEAIASTDFKEKWNITKNQVIGCKDCEYRFVCTDCRAYLEDPIDIFSKPLKCGYDPYSGTWSEWSTNPLKKQAIYYYGLATP